VIVLGRIRRLLSTGKRECRRAGHGARLDCEMNQSAIPWPDGVGPIRLRSGHRAFTATGPTDAGIWHATFLYSGSTEAQSEGEVPVRRHAHRVILKGLLETRGQRGWLSVL